MNYTVEKLWLSFIFSLSQRCGQLWEVAQLQKRVPAEVPPSGHVWAPQLPLHLPLWGGVHRGQPPRRAPQPAVPLAWRQQSQGTSGHLQALSAQLHPLNAFQWLLYSCSPALLLQRPWAADHTGERRRHAEPHQYRVLTWAPLQSWRPALDPVQGRLESLPRGAATQQRAEVPRKPPWRRVHEWTGRGQGVLRGIIQNDHFPQRGDWKHLLHALSWERSAQLRVGDCEGFGNNGEVWHLILGFGAVSWYLLVWTDLTCKNPHPLNALFSPRLPACYTSVVLSLCIFSSLFSRCVSMKYTHWLFKKIHKGLLWTIVKHPICTCLGFTKKQMCTGYSSRTMLNIPMMLL